MQSVTIRPAQVMMEYMAGEQEKISQGVSSQHFSKQLQNQTAEILTRQQNSLADALIRPQEKTDSGSQTGRASRKEQSASRKTPPDNEDSDKKSKVRSSDSVTAGTLSTQAWKTAQELTFSDEAALDKVLNELQVSPDLRDSLKGDALLNGSISLQQLTSTLDRAAQDEGTLTEDTKVGAADVNRLMASLQNGKNGQLGDTSSFQLKSDGFYTLPEFRKLLQRVSEQTAQQQTSQSLQGIGGDQGTAGSGSATASKTVSGGVNGKLTSQPDSVEILLARSLMDDVTAGNNAVSHQGSSTGKGETPSGISSAASVSLSQTNQGSAESTSSSQTPGTATNSQTTPSSGTAATSAATAGSTAQVGSAVSAQTPVLNTGGALQGLAGVSGTASLSAASAAIAAGSASTAGTGLNVSTAANLLKTLEGNGEAVIRSFHFEPESLRSGNSQQSLAADTALKQAIMEGLSEKIAASQRTDAQTTDQNGQQLSAFLRQGTLVASTGNMATAEQSQGTQLSNLSFWSQMLAERVKEMQQHSQQRLSLEVDSPELGRVTLRVETENNQVRAVIGTETQQACDLLQRSAPQLRQQLTTQGLELGQLSIDVQDRRSQRDLVPQRSHQQGRNTVGSSSPVGSSVQWMLPGTAGQSVGSNTIISVFA